MEFLRFGFYPLKKIVEDPPSPHGLQRFEINPRFGHFHWDVILKCEKFILTLKHVSTREFQISVHSSINIRVSCEKRYVQYTEIQIRGNTTTQYIKYFCLNEPYWKYFVYLQGQRASLHCWPNSWVLSEDWLGFPYYKQVWDFNFKLKTCNLKGASLALAALREGRVLKSILYFLCITFLPPMLLLEEQSK